ncbi:MAG TPA: hypothetical protein PKD72_05835 [Gemmatales bacterium]|nr:hypothetical protein [Gemmatales bacterium]
MQRPRYYPGLFWLSLATATMAFILIGSGGTVTSTGVGMVDHSWSFEPVKLLTVRGLEEAMKSLGMFIEHSHRQLGYIVGMLALTLASYCLAVEQGYRRWLGVAVLLAVAIQGALGAARILLFPRQGIIDISLGRDFAMIHGFFGQVTFAFLAGCTLAFSRSWVSRVQVSISRYQEYLNFSNLLVVLFLVQLMLAVLVRHYGGTLLILAHASMAALILIFTGLLVWQVRSLDGSIVAWPVYALGLEVLMMILLGTAAWWMGGGSGALVDDTPAQELLHRMTLATLHQWLGALTLATSLIVAMRVRQHLIPANPTGGETA